jgi:signal transduction histidine kinase/ligand-binding sensor domain-containing protein/DNA-binding response OmpR family regulator
MHKAAKILFCGSWFLFFQLTYILSQPQLKFQHLTTTDGLPSNMNYNIFQDHQGFLWFANQSGLVRYDGYECKIYSPDSLDPYSISTSWVNQICEDSLSDLWIGSPFNGINKYERETGNFFHFNQRNGLSSDSIFQCYMDRSDILWIVHTNGMLDKLDTKYGKILCNPHLPKGVLNGKKFNVYYYGNYLNLIAISDDSRGNVWIGTRGAGVFCYNRKQNTYTQYLHDPNNRNSLSCDTVTCIYEDKNKTIWIASWGGGLNRFLPETNSFAIYRHLDNNKNSLSNNFCLNLFGDNLNKIWITVRGGLDCVDPESKSIRHYKNEPDKPGSLNFKSLYFEVFAVPVYEDKTGYLWIHIGGTPFRQDAYDIFDSQFNTFSHCFVNMNDQAGYRGIYSNSFLCDNSGIIWISGTERGINKLNPTMQQFAHYTNDPLNSNSLSYCNATAVLESKYLPGTLWIATTGGLDRYTLNTDEFRHYKPDPKDLNSLVDSFIYSLCEDDYGVLWIGTSEGYSCYNIKNNTFKNFVNILGDPKSTGPYTVWCIYKDNEGTIWLVDRLTGLYYFERKTGKLTKYGHHQKIPENLLSGGLNCIYQDRSGIYWVGSDDGLIQFDLRQHIFNRYLTDKMIQVIYEDNSNNLWLGTRLDGLVLFNRQKGKASFYAIDDGLCNNKINTIVDDENGNLWLGTEGGLSRYTIQTGTFTNFNQDDGLPSQLFDWHAARISNGQIWMPTIDNGVVAFDPEKISYNPVPPKIVITGIEISNEPLKSGDHSPLSEDITVSKEIHLKYFQNNISMECTALHYSISQKNQYAFWLENYDKGWHNARYNRIATYTNLDPGKYIFHVKASNSDNVWNEEGITLRIIISPPWWRTGWAYFLYLLFLGGVVFLIWKELRRRDRMKQELKMKQFEADKLQELDHMKSNFFANISHELRTPLTLIVGPVEQLIDEIYEKKWNGILQLVLRNSRQLLRLINQLLDFSKLEAGRMKLSAREEDIVPLLKGMVFSFNSLAERKKIDLSVNTEQDKLNIFIDQDKLGKIISNLLSNAFKYTSSGGKIQVELSVVTIENTTNELVYRPQKVAEIRVSDTGIGIPPEHLSHIFDRYYRIDEKDGQTGTGIGLALTKELVELHHGSVSVESVPGKGSLFIVHLPLGKNHLTDNEMAESQPGKPIPDEDNTEVSLSDDTDSIGEQTASEQKDIILSEKKASRLLIVEDTEDVRIYIRGLLSSNYEIEEAVDGLDGYEKAIESIPDLIISDVMMPKMDGFVLCEKMKTDERTSHIPVILLTARASEASKLEGLETGADVYLVKPFNAKELLIRVNKLIEQRQKLRERFSRDITLSPKEISVTSTDERFLNRALEVIEKHMSDTEFGVDVFGKEVGMSHSHLHRKIKALTNQSPVELIRSIRLKRAASLLIQKYGNISEVAYATGFNSPAYFSDCFLKQFGKSPSAFIAQA